MSERIKWYKCQRSRNYVVTEEMANIVREEVPTESSHSPSGGIFSSIGQTEPSQVMERGES